MANRNGTRIRWVESERALLVQQSQLVLAKKPGESLKDVIEEAMHSLPPERRRKVDTKTVLWIREAVRALPPLRKEPATTSIASPESLDNDAEKQPHAPAEPLRPPSAVASSHPLTAALIDSGVEILLGVLSDPRLRLAVRELLSPSAPPKAASMEGAVAVVGLQPNDAKTVAKTYEGMLPLRTWSLDQTREQLEECVGEARLVIGMQEQLSQAIDSSLRRLGDRYVQNQGGMQGLHKRLAEEAMR